MCLSGFPEKYQRKPGRCVEGYQWFDSTLPHTRGSASGWHPSPNIIRFTLTNEEAGRSSRVINSKL